MGPLSRDALRYEGSFRPAPTKKTRNAALLRRIITHQEAPGGVLHPEWQPTNCPEPKTVTKNQIQTNEHPAPRRRARR